MTNSEVALYVIADPTCVVGSAILLGASPMATIFTDSDSVQRLQALAAAFEVNAAEWTLCAAQRGLRGDTAGQERALTVANDAREAAERVRMRIAASTETPQAPGLAEILAKLPDGKFTQIEPCAAMSPLFALDREAAAAPVRSWWTRACESFERTLTVALLVCPVGGSPWRL